jgi:hypothetical protein
VGRLDTEARHVVLGWLEPKAWHLLLIRSSKEGAKPMQVRPEVEHGAILEKPEGDFRAYAESRRL